MTQAKGYSLSFQSGAGGASTSLPWPQSKKDVAGSIMKAPANLGVCDNIYARVLRLWRRALVCKMFQAGPCRVPMLQKGRTPVRVEKGFGS